MRTLTISVAALLLGLCSSASATIPLKATFKPQNQGEVEFAPLPAASLGWTNVTPLEFFEVLPEPRLPGATLQYRVRINGHEESRWLNQGNRAGRVGGTITAVDFRIVGPRAGDHVLVFNVQSPDGIIEGVSNSWNSLGEKPIGVVAVIITIKSEISSYENIDTKVKDSSRDTQTAQVAVERERKKAPVTATVLSGVGAVLGFIYGGPEGAVEGAIVGYGLGKGLEDGLIAFHREGGKVLLNLGDTVGKIKFAEAANHVKRDLNN